MGDRASMDTKAAFGPKTLGMALGAALAFASLGALWAAPEARAAAQPSDTAGTDKAGVASEAGAGDVSPVADETAPMDAAAEIDRTMEERQTEAASFLKQIADDAFKILNNQDLDDEQRYAAFQDVLTNGLAIRRIGHLMLGSGRREATEDQLEIYEDVFPEFITRLYAAQLAKIAKVGVEVLATSVTRRGYIYVHSNLQRMNGRPIKVDWGVIELEDAEGGLTPKIIDIVVEGASFVSTKREEFKAVVRNRGFEALLAELQKRSGSLAGVL